MASIKPDPNPVDYAIENKINATGSLKTALKC